MHPKSVGEFRSKSAAVLERVTEDKETAFRLGVPTMLGIPAPRSIPCAAARPDSPASHPSLT